MNRELALGVLDMKYDSRREWEIFRNSHEEFGEELLEPETYHPDSSFEKRILKGLEELDLAEQESVFRYNVEDYDLDAYREIELALTM